MAGVGGGATVDHTRVGVTWLLCYTCSASKAADCWWWPAVGAMVELLVHCCDTTTVAVLPLQWHNH